MTTNHKPWDADKTWVRMGDTWVRMGDGVIATIIRTYPEAATDDELIAAARKMAAAQELLAALEQMADEVGRNYGETAYDIYPDVFAAIAKARGTEPDHDPPDSRNHMAKPYDEALIGHLRNNPPRNE